MLLRSQMEMQVKTDVHRASRKAVSPLRMVGFGRIAEWHFIDPGDAPATINAAFIGAGLIFPRSGLVVHSLADPVPK